MYADTDELAFAWPRQMERLSHFGILLLVAQDQKALSAEVLLETAVPRPLHAVVLHSHGGDDRPAYDLALHRAEQLLEARLTAASAAAHARGEDPLACAVIELKK